jgi:Flp pilus assembly protein TadG
MWVAAMTWTDAVHRILRIRGITRRGYRCVADSFRLRDGTAAIEFAIISPILMILLGGLVEIGIAAYQAMQVQAAVQAGVLYAAQNGVSNLSAIELAVTSATGTTGITATPIPLVFCGCPVAAGVVSQGSNCTTVCTGGAAPGQYVTVSAALPHQTIMSFLNLPIPATLTASSTVRIQ